MILLVVTLFWLAVAAAPLRREYHHQSLTRSNGVPDRIIWLRICGIAPIDTTQPIAGISCSSDMENVALACRDTHIGYLCHNGHWTTNGK
jgi:hypothetical protein